MTVALTVAANRRDTSPSIARRTRSIRCRASAQGKCGYGHKPCNISALKAECDATNGCGGFNSNGWLKQGPLNASSLHRTPSAVEDNSSFFLRSSATLTCEYDYDGDGEADSPTEHAGMYWAWRSAFVAALRQRMGEKALIFANSAGAVSDPSLSGVTIEMESCTGGKAGVQHCSDALEGQRAATLAAGREAVSVLWMTHSESMSAAQQCQTVADLQQQYPWVQAGTDFFDGSHVVC